MNFTAKTLILNRKTTHRWDYLIISKKYPECKTTEDWFYKGNQLASSGNLDDAIKCFDEAIKLNVNNSQAWNNKG